MKLKLLDTNEVTLETKDKLCKENISLVVDNTNITPENIKSGVSILGVNGTLQGGGGSSVEACTVTIIYSFSPGASSNTITYTTPGMTSKTLTLTPDQTYTIQCAKNTIMAFGNIINASRTEGDVIKLGRSGPFLVTGDGTISIE